jgi:uncharacterized repeat protein (TIGR04138 family)
VSESSPTRTLGEIADELGFPFEAVDLIESVTADMAWHAANAGLTVMPQLTAKGFCQLLRRRAQSEFGKSAASVLTGWGLRDSCDVGRIVFALVAASWIEASQDDSVDDFVGLFTVDEYFV